MKKTTLNLDDIKLLHHAGKLDEARNGYLALLQSNPDDVDVLHLLGLLCAEDNHLDEARNYLVKARDLSPQNAALRLHLANILKASGQYEASVKELQAVIADDPECAPAFNNLGTVYFAAKQYDLASHAYHAALDIRADYVDAYYNLGLACMKTDRDDEAVAAFRALLAITPGHTGAHFQSGCLMMKRNSFQDAAREFEMILDAHPHHYESLVNLANCYLHLGRVDQSAEYYLRALEIMPNDRDLLFNLGVIHLRQGYTRDAVNYYLRAIQADPDFFDVRQNLGAIYVMARDYENALLQFREALRIKPDHEATRHMIRILTQDASLTTSAPAYIQSLFDSYADYYDAHMAAYLHYQVPDKFHAAVSKAGILGEQNLDILDIGCGTGLCGQVFKPHARSLTGIDLSEKMLAAAGHKNIYDELQLVDAEQYLMEHPHAFDLILAGDVLVYFGELYPLVTLVSKSLRPRGYFAFNVEINKDGDFSLTPSGRFAHHKNYLARLAREHGFEVVVMESEAMRRQADILVPGYLCIWRRAS